MGDGYKLPLPQQPDPPSRLGGRASQKPPLREIRVSPSRKVMAPHSSPIVGNQLKCAIVMPITLAPRTGCYACSPDRQDDWERENATNPDGSLDRGGRGQTNLPNGT